MRRRAKGGREQGDRCSAPAGIWVPAHFLTQKTHPSSSVGRRDHPSVPWSAAAAEPGCEAFPRPPAAATTAVEPSRGCYFYPLKGFGGPRDDPELCHLDVWLPGQQGWGPESQGRVHRVVAPHRSQRGTFASAESTGHVALTATGLRTVISWALERKHPDVSQREAHNADLTDLTFWPDPFRLGPRGPVRSRPVSGTDLHSAPCRRPGGLRVPGAPGRVARRSRTRLCLKDQGGFKTGRKEMSQVIASHRLTGWGKGEREESSHPVWGNRAGRAYSSQTVT